MNFIDSNMFTIIHYFCLQTDDTKNTTTVDITLGQTQTDYIY